ncbi:MAG: glycerol-3-phosphate dehydrogenase/oxidase [Povalibacter sp.]
MRRNLHQLSETEYDVLIVGAGAFGACAARDAALRGLRTALIERNDFGGGTSAECFKMVHGGIRYLQHADLKRLRASCHERSALLRIAPHLVHPLPIAIPTYGHGRRGSLFLGTGARLYDALTWGRNNGIRDRERHIDGTRILDRGEVLALFPALESPELSGAVVFEDGQMHNPARLVLAFVSSAVHAGADVANRVEALRYRWKDNTVVGARVRDTETGNEFDIRAKLTLNASGPWADYLCLQDDRFKDHQREPFSRDAYFVIDRAPAHDHALAVQGLSRDKDALLGRATRHLFMAPWRDKTLVGVWHRGFDRNPDLARVAPEEIDHWIAEVNQVHPALKIDRSEVTFANCGLVPFGETATESELSFGKESRVIDHRARDGVNGLVTLIGIRYTTARADAAQALELLLQQSGMKTSRPKTEDLPVAGGNIADFAQFAREAYAAWPAHVSRGALAGVLRNFGTDHLALLDRVKADPSAAATIPHTTTLLGEVAHAVDHEMALRLEDVVLRRTDLAGGSHPGSAALLLAANEMATRLRWSAKRTADEVHATEQILRNHLAKPAIQGAQRQPAVDAAASPQATMPAMAFLGNL